MPKRTPPDKLMLLNSIGTMLPDVLQALDKSKHPIVNWIRNKLEASMHMPPPMQAFMQASLKSLLEQMLTDHEKQTILTMYDHVKRSKINEK